MLTRVNGQDLVGVGVTRLSIDSYSMHDLISIVNPC